ncbi:SET domain-containing protein [Mollisia scopiformis]|uniref:SET domain-containing protein n=1 Tax=Mollisia scopiformis TaxID=149040 RepID=A0A132B952_MOLSC|nr:SET domain-containing protein [Mollisia scopiformis]KUJ08901.1 SET domain-containing protein [Mollisia scopiformis]
MTKLIPIRIVMDFPSQFSSSASIQATNLSSTSRKLFLPSIKNLISIQSQSFSITWTRPSALPEYSQITTSSRNATPNQNIIAIDTSVEGCHDEFQPKNALRASLAIPYKDESTVAIEHMHKVANHPTVLHNIPRPVTPDPTPAHMTPAPIRYPETLGTLVKIGESEGKGLGVFAAKDLLPGTILLCELPLLEMSKIDEDEVVEATVNLLSPEKKKIFMSFSAYTENKTDERALMGRIMDCNCFSIGGDTAIGIFETSSRINHSCVPNSSYGWRDSIGRLVVYNLFKLLEGEELTIDYGHKTRSLRANYGFECDCGGCTDRSLRMTPRYDVGSGTAYCVDHDYRNGNGVFNAN